VGGGKRGRNGGPSFLFPPIKNSVKKEERVAGPGGKESNITSKGISKKITIKGIKKRILMQAERQKGSQLVVLLSFGRR